jgi:DNA processing protein
VQVIQTYLEEDVLYLYALSLLKGIGTQTLLRIVKTTPRFSELSLLSSESLQERLGASAGKAVFQSLHEPADQWQNMIERAKRELHQHFEQDIFPLAITSELYPPTLRLIPDPPPILYVKGNIELLRVPRTVAIIGTREPTQRGLFVAHQIASQLAERDYTIISGLAKGIDGAAHEGALSVQGKTIAVFGTPLDTIYPAEHRSLAERILAASGVIVSELALGQRGFQTAFVRRDRIQSGLSLAVLPIQTRNNGGTMHTVRFARIQNRLVICPKPAPSEAYALQYEGIKTLLSEGKERTLSFTVEHVNYSKLLSLFQQKLHDLLPYAKDEQEKLNGSAFSSEEDTYKPETSDTAPLPSFQQQELLNHANTETVPLPLVYATLPSIQRTLSAVREAEGQFIPSPQLALAQTSFWEQESTQPATSSTDLVSLEAHTSAQSKQRKKRRKKEIPLWEQLESLHEEEAMEDLKKLD